MFETVREDLSAARKWNSGSLAGELLNPGTQAVLAYRFGRWVFRVRVPLVRHALILAYMAVDYYVRACIGVTIHRKAEIGPGFLIHSHGGIFVGPTRIGRGFVLQKGAHVNWNSGEIGDDVVLGPGCHIGRGVSLGHRVLVGPNAVVTSSVPDDCTVAVLPPRVLPIRMRERRAAPVTAAQERT
jgi:serine O-acetyltransferase